MILPPPAERNTLWNGIRDGIPPILTLPRGPLEYRRMSRTGTVAAALFVSAWAAAGAELAVYPAASVELALPGVVEAQLVAPDPAEWVRAGRLRLDVAVSPNAPAAIQTLVVVRDWDSHPFQRLVATPLSRGVTNALDIDVGPYAEGWEPLGHPGAWHRRSLLRPEEVAVRLFDFSDIYTGVVQIVRAELVPLADDAPPAFRNVRPTEATPAHPAVDGRFELRFDLPDRYANPFDPDEIAVDAEIATPSGATVSLRVYSSTLALFGVIVAHLTPTPYFLIAFAAPFVI